VSTENSFDFDTAVRLLDVSDPRWRRDIGTAKGEPSSASLHRFAHAIAFVLDEMPRWLETVTYPGPSGTAETEVRALGANALFVVTTPWSTDGDHEPELTVRVRPLTLLHAVEVDGFEYRDDGYPVGCMITLVFAGGPSVRLGASAGAVRSDLAPLLPSLLRRVGA
jgi:hypothetical protein